MNETGTLFLHGFGLSEHSVVSIVGAGGKTSLMFQLAKEVRLQKKSCLVTTSTKMLIPNEDESDALDLSGTLFGFRSPEKSGLYVAGVRHSMTGKMVGPDMGLLARCLSLYDHIFIEADGSAGKPLKGWKETEPVVPEFSSHTIGVVDIQVVGRTINSQLVHRLDIFKEITGALAGDSVSVVHLARVVKHERGLFFHGVGSLILYINKVESEKDLENAQQLKGLLADVITVIGSVRDGIVHA